MSARTDGEVVRRDAGHVVAGRYRLVAALGEGAFGEVWEAEDVVLGERVALKRLRATGPESAKARREIATLRVLRFPGVVHLLDEGEDAGRPFFVTELVQGSPFPGLAPSAAGAGPSFGPTIMRTTFTTAWSATMDATTANATAAPGAGPIAVTPTPGCHAWPALAGVTEALLRTLQRVHAAGIVHRDLKPANVLVRPDGQPVVLDFGLCLPTAESARLPHENVIEGTPAYLSPEQIRGGPIDARADLYAVGVMIYEALTGSLPHDAPNLRTLLALRASQRAIPLRTREPSVPLAVAEVVDRLLAPSPADRPAGAAEVLERWFGRGAGTPAFAGLLPQRAGSHTEVALRELFAGRDRLFHLREDGARVLHLRTAGDPRRVREEIAAWIDAGIARPDGDRLIVDRAALDRWEAGFSLVLADGNPVPENDGAVAEAWSRARRFAEQGRLGVAAAALEQGLAAGRRPPFASVDVETSLLAEWVKVAFAEQRAHALDRVLYEVCGARARASPAVAQMEGLLRAAISLRTFFSAEPAAAAEQLGAFADPELERWRYWVRVRAWMFVDPGAAERALDEAQAWAERVDSAAAQAAVAGLRGTVAYVCGRFAEAARLHASAATFEPWLSLRVTQMLNEATALLDACDPARSREVAERAAALAAQCRHPHFEGRAQWTARTAEYRTGAAMLPDLELVAAHVELDVRDSLGMVCLTEAAIAFRAGDLRVTAELAGRALETWQRSGQRWPALLARALAGAAGVGLSLDEARSLAELSASCPVPGLGIQALGLLRRACPGLPAPAPEGLAALCAQVPREHWADRLDVLSVDEARAAF